MKTKYNRWGCDNPHCSSMQSVPEGEWPTGFIIKKGTHTYEGDRVVTPKTFACSPACVGPAILARTKEEYVLLEEGPIPRVPEVLDEKDTRPRYLSGNKDTEITLRECGKWHMTSHSRGPQCPDGVVNQPSQCTNGSTLKVWNMPVNGPLTFEPKGDY